MKKKIAVFVITGITMLGLSSFQVYAMGGGMGGGMGSSGMGGSQSGRSPGPSSDRSSNNYEYMHGQQQQNQNMNNDLHNEILNQHMGDGATYINGQPNTGSNRKNLLGNHNEDASRNHTDQMGLNRNN